MRWKTTPTLVPIRVAKDENVPPTGKRLLGNVRFGYSPPSAPECAALIELVEKLDSRLRFYVDHRQLNSATNKDICTLLRIVQTLGFFGGLDIPLQLS